MKKHRTMRSMFSSLLSLLLVISMLAPVSANERPIIQSLETLSEQLDEEILTTEQQQTLLRQVEVSETNHAVLHEELEQIVRRHDQATARVIVHLTERPATVEDGLSRMEGRTLTKGQRSAVTKRVTAQQQRVEAELKRRNIQLTGTLKFDTVMNGFAANIATRDIPALLQVKGVALVEPDYEMSTMEQTESATPSLIEGPSFLQVDQLWEKGITGKGVKVAVIDTGVDANHPDLKHAYKGGKNFVPFDPSTYAVERKANDGSETKPEERAKNVPPTRGTSTFETTHGTHVAGTIAAKGVGIAGVKGIAPDVDLYSYRVLGAYGSGYTSSIVAAVDESVKQNMDVINLSLGGGANVESDASSFAINNAVLNGVTALIATGNSGSNRETMGTPATAPLGIAVGNSTQPEASYKMDMHMTLGDETSQRPIDLMLTELGASLEETLKGERALVAVPGVGSAEDFATVDVKDKVAVVVRGDLPFYEKMEHARDAGATAIIIYNSENGSNAPNRSDVNLGAAFDVIPTFDMSYTDGAALVEALATTEGTVSFTNVQEEKSKGDEMAASSSRGPSIPNFDIKPDVVAPGSNILSTMPVFEGTDYAKAYATKTGTSMATPHVAGVAALLLQANPSWTPADVKIAMSNTATVLDEKYDVFTQGGGRVEPTKAVQPELFAYVERRAMLDATGADIVHKKPAVTFGYLDLSMGNLNEKQEMTIRSNKKESETYNVHVNMIRNDADVNVTLNRSTITTKADEQSLVVTLSGKRKIDAKAGDEANGYIVFTRASTGETVASVPFAAEFGKVAPTKVTYFVASQDDFAFNAKDGAYGEVYFQLTEDVGLNYLEVIDLQRSDLTKGDFHSLGYLHNSFGTQAGFHAISFDGTYLPWDGKGKTAKLEDGIYALMYRAQPVTNNPAVISRSILPMYVKSTDPEVSFRYEEGVIKGKVKDDYIDLIGKWNRMVNRADSLNDKLTVAYTVQSNGVESERVKATLEEDGTFELTVKEKLRANDTLVLNIFDATGYEEKVAIVGELQQLKQPEAPSTPQFTDIGQSYAKESIEALVEAGVIKGKTPTIFDTKSNVTRAQFATMLTRALDLEVKPHEGRFKDVPAGLTSHKGIEAAARAGIVAGRADGTFAPNESITRQQMAAMIVRAIEYEMQGEALIVSKPKAFKDEKEISRYALDAVYKVSALNIMHGDGLHFKPQQNVNREQSAVILHRTLQLLGK